MPKMNGRELAEEAVKIKPEIKVLFMSGYAEDIIARHGILDNGIVFLDKSILNDQLIPAVRKLLDEKAPVK